MSEVKSRIEALEQEKTQLNPSDVNDRFRIQQIDAEIAGLQATLEQAEREQKKQETLSDYVDIVSQMFEALFPSEKYRPLFGITEYEEKRAQFYQLNHAYVTEKIEEIHQENELALALKDERYRLLNDQALAVQNQLDEARQKAEGAFKEIEELEARVNEANDQIRSIAAERDEAVSKFIAADLKANELKVQVDELTQKLEAAQQPKESKPSQKLADIMSEIKSKNDLKADDWIARWNARQKSDEAKIPLPEISVPEVTESPFRNEDTASNVEVDRILPPEVAEVAQDSFPGEGDTESGHIEIPTYPADGTVVQKTVEERLEALERAVFGEKGAVA